MHAFGRRPGLVKPAYIPRQLRADDDKRFAPRRQSQTPAVVTFDGAMETLPCLIRDMSATGARLEWRKAGNPFVSKWPDIDRVWLMIRADRVMYDCKIVRRGDADIAVRFVAAPRAVTRFAR